MNGNSGIDCYSKKYIKVEIKEMPPEPPKGIEHRFKAVEQPVLQF